MNIVSDSQDTAESHYVFWISAMDAGNGGIAAIGITLWHLSSPLRLPMAICECLVIVII